MPGGIGAPELIVILVIALLVLGPKKLPEVGKSLGKGMREFKDSLSNANPFEDEDEDERPTRRRPAQVEATGAQRPAAPAARPAAEAVASSDDAREAQDAFGANKS
jgi:sec-independent protein translocase protein TatA